jgi:DMSO/TMAO reductase YedYZ molybdopterin-dependent catalytic subunit
MGVDHITFFTPLHDYMGIITPTPLHFVQQHSSHLPEIDAQQHRLTIHGLVDRPLSFGMDDLKRLPSVSRIHFVECHANSSPLVHDNGNEFMGLPVQYVHGLASCSEWTGVPLSVLLNEAGLQKEASWVVAEGATPASSRTASHSQRRSMTASWPMARMASRCGPSRATRCGSGARLGGALQRQVPETYQGDGPGLRDLE